MSQRIRCNTTGWLFMFSAVQYAHLECLKSWVHERGLLVCEICKSSYNEALLPELEPQIRSDGDQESGIMDSGPPFLGFLIPMGETHSPEESRWRSRKFWTRLLVIGLCVGSIAAVLIILGVNASDHVWAAVLLRIIAFGLPLIFVARALIACFELRSSHNN